MNVCALSAPSIASGFYDVDWCGIPTTQQLENVNSILHLSAVGRIYFFRRPIRIMTRSLKLTLDLVFCGSVTRCHVVGSASILPKVPIVSTLFVLSYAIIYTRVVHSDCYTSFITFYVIGKMISQHQGLCLTR
jgi:hypothetical protein